MYIYIYLKGEYFLRITLLLKNYCVNLKLLSGPLPREAGVYGTQSGAPTPPTVWLRIILIRSTFRQWESFVGTGGVRARVRNAYISHSRSH